MGFFSRKSKEPNPVNDAVNRSIKEAEQQQETQIKLVEVRKTKEDIDNDFFDLVTSREVAEKSHKAAQANESKLEKLEQADAANKATGKENVSKLWEMEKDIYIIPGGYVTAPWSSWRVNIRQKHRLRQWIRERISFIPISKNTSTVCAALSRADAP